DMEARDDQVQPQTRSISFMRRELSRRSFVSRGIALGLSVPAITSLLAACGDDDATDDGAAEADDEPAVEDDGNQEPAAEDDGDEEDDEDPTGDEDGDEEPVAEDESDAEDEDRYGDTLYVALLGEPPRIDVQAGTGVTVNFVAWNMWETLLTWDEDFNTVPELA